MCVFVCVGVVVGRGRACEWGAVLVPPCLAPLKLRASPGSGILRPSPFALPPAPCWQPACNLLAPFTLMCACLPACVRADLNVYKSNLIKESIRMGHNELGDFFYSRGDLQARCMRCVRCLPCAVRVVCCVRAVCVEGFRGPLEHQCGRCPGWEVWGGRSFTVGSGLCRL